MRRLLLATLATSLLVVTSAQAAPGQRPPVTWLRGEGNYTKSSRKPTAIRLIVVHVTEGAFWPSIQWLKSEHAHASSHYIVSRRGKIIQLVHQSDIAWHAGNWRTNVLSVGIEHEGIVDDPAGFTEAQYKASARLAAYIARTSLIPINRAHFIGHADVPNPFDASLRGGSDGHTDPGRYWNWKHYLKLVRKYAYPKPRKKIRLVVTSKTFTSGQFVSGTVPWRAGVKGPVRRVDVFVDGKRVLRDLRAPFGGRWNTTRFANGRHVVELRAYGPKGSWTRKRLILRVHNRRVPPLVLGATGIRSGAEVGGVVTVGAELGGGIPAVALLYLDGKRIDHDTRVPFAFNWDSTRVANGRHVLELRMRARDGRRISRKYAVVVANAPALAILKQSLADGQTVSGAVPWQVDVAGKIERIDLLVDGTVRASLATAPYTWTWDTSGETPGSHTLVARAIGMDGKVVEATLSVTVG